MFLSCFQDQVTPSLKPLTGFPTLNGIKFNLYLNFRVLHNLTFAYIPAVITCYSSSWFNPLSLMLPSLTSICSPSFKLTPILGKSYSLSAMCPCLSSFKSLIKTHFFMEYFLPCSTLNSLASAVLLLPLCLSHLSHIVILLGK